MRKFILPVVALLFIAGVVYWRGADQSQAQGGGPVCGNGHIEGESCDDGNKKKGDGCSKVCAVEAGWKCKGKTGQQSVCTKKK